MKFFIDNQKIEAQIQWVLSQLKMHMNGAASSQMKERGIEYRENYGVAIPHLKQIASRLPVSFELAERLWYMEIRETMLLAALLVPSDKMTMDLCDEWVRLAKNNDIIERSSMFLWSRLGFVDKICGSWLTSGDTNKMAIGAYTLGRYLQLNRTYISIDGLFDLLLNCNQIVVKASSFAIRMFWRANKKISQQQKDLIQALKNNPNSIQKIVAQELMVEMEYLEL